ncbi:hypothetical protein BH24ACT5_BH24ACT5_11230 [soil metagenome]
MLTVAAHLLVLGASPAEYRDPRPVQTGQNVQQPVIDVDLRDEGERHEEEIPLDGTGAGALEVEPSQPLRGPQTVAPVRLAVQPTVRLRPRPPGAPRGSRGSRSEQAIPVAGSATDAPSRRGPLRARPPAGTPDAGHHGHQHELQFWPPPATAEATRRCCSSPPARPDAAPRSRLRRPHREPPAPLGSPHPHCRAHDARRSPATLTRSNQACDWAPEDKPGEEPSTGTPRVVSGADPRSDGGHAHIAGYGRDRRRVR